IAMLDTGVKLSIVRKLRERGATVELHPCAATAPELMQSAPDAIFLANGPGDPAALGYIVETVRELVGKRPVYGICLGHQLLCRAVGLETYKLPFGHHGANHPVKDLTTGRVEITSQNHGFAVLGPDGSKTIDRDEAVRWETDFGAAELTHINLYDRTVEGLALRDVPGATVPYHPEAGPGPHDAEPEIATTTYIEPLPPGPVTQVIMREKPDALLPTLGGQTALNLATALSEDGTLEEHGVELIGADHQAINRAEDRELFRRTMTEAGLRVPKSVIAHSVDEARAALPDVGL